MTAPGLHHHPFWLPVAIAGLLAVLSFWLARLAQMPAAMDMGGFGHEPDYIVENFQATAFDAQGLPRYRLAAGRMTHYMDDDTTALEQPRFVREIPGQPTWRAVARRGVVSSNGENVHLLDDVRIERRVAGQAVPLVLTTDYLWVIPEADILRTDKPIILRQGTSQVTAGGMEVDGKQHTLRLAGRVRGIYESRH
jgi:lipopolysaccharide export system protein LptC